MTIKRVTVELDYGTVEIAVLMNANFYTIQVTKGLMNSVSTEDC